MHYTALVGTVYYPGDSNSGPPTPVLGASALIGIISAIVLVACILLFAIVAKAKMENGKLPFQTTSYKRLILDTIFFDSNGRIMVKVDGIVPMKEVLSSIPEDVNDFVLLTGCTNIKSMQFIRNMKHSLQVIHYLQPFLKPPCSGRHKIANHTATSVLMEPSFELQLN
jgi:hypothetical protein